MAEGLVVNDAETAYDGQDAREDAKEDAREDVPSSSTAEDPTATVSPSEVTAVEMAGTNPPDSVSSCSLEDEEEEGSKHGESTEDQEGSKRGESTEERIKRLLRINEETDVRQRELCATMHLLESRVDRMEVESEHVRNMYRRDLGLIVDELGKALEEDGDTTLTQEDITTTLPVRRSARRSSVQGACHRTKATRRPRCLERLK